MADVRLNNLAAVFGSHRAFDGFTLTIRDGECFTLLGPSGCGKTVVLRMIAGFEHPSAGEVFIGDRLVSSAAPQVHVPTELRQIGVVFQDYAVWPHKTVFENVAYPLQIQRIPATEIKSRSLEAIGQVHLTGLEDRYPAQLSGGQQQRVAIVRALAMGPMVMLLDEITSALDPELVAEVLAIVRDLASDGMTMLLATHEMGFAREVASKICFLYDGRVHEEGPPAEIFGSPREERTRSFLKRIIDAGRL